MRFENLSILPEIKSNLTAMGFIRTTDIQYKTIPAILKGEDVLAIAQTGTGKTAAFAIPIINLIHELSPKKRKSGIQCIVLVPTRELAQQIGKVFAKLTRNTKVTSYAIYGGADQDPQINQLNGGVDVLIATPGRMFDLISQGFVGLNAIETVVLDEADHMLDLGFIEDIKQIKFLLKNRRHQTLFFSATINPTIKKLAYSQIKSSALRIQVSPEKMVSKNITHSVVEVEMDEKRHLLTRIIETNPEAKIMVFARTQVRVERVCRHLSKNEITTKSLHGGQDQQDRNANLAEFREQSSGVLIATDVSARGIDLPNITHVINYDLPDDPENYVHRIGRTGRGFAKGDAISFCSPEEKQKREAIEQMIHTKISRSDIDKDYLLETSSDKLESLEISEIIDFEESLIGGKSKKKKRKK